MSRNDRHPGVVQIASNLKLGWDRSPSEAIIQHCKDRVADWLRGAPDVRTLDALEQLVCTELRLVLHDFWTNDEFAALLRYYVEKGEFVFAALREQFSPDTYATLVRRDSATPSCPDQYVALIDCRGDKSARRAFTRWHEIAHVLTFGEDQMILPFYNRSRARDPVEQLMDKIAGEIGFYSPLFAPAVAEAVSRAGGLTFAAIEQIRSAVCPSASLHATTIAAVREAPIPALLLEAAMGLKKEEERQLSHPGLFPGASPVPKLRVTSVGHNQAARGVLRVHPNMRVPETSVISRLYHDSLSSEAAGVENLDEWTTSDGGSAGTGMVQVEARRRGQDVMALMTR